MRLSEILTERAGRFVMDTRIGHFASPKPNTGVVVLQNPSRPQVVQAIERAKNHSLRGFMDEQGDDVYVWDGFIADHTQIKEALFREQSIEVGNYDAFYLSKQSTRIIMRGMSPGIQRVRANPRVQKWETV